jgi:hypothetical protein
MRIVSAKVVIIAPREDRHGQILARALSGMSVPFARISLCEARRVPLSWRLGGDLTFYSSGNYWSIGTWTTAWWRRFGAVDVSDLSDEEGSLIASEVEEALLGCLLTAQVRWVDHPMVVQQAENKLFQLHVARQVGLRVPESIVTNRPREARRFASECIVLAKPLSSGSGLAPFADAPHTSLLSLVKSAPTFLQAVVRASADLRIVTIGERAWAWQRARSPSDPLDWRVADPHGSGFVPVGGAQKERSGALRLAKALKLSISVQDWLLINREESYFLEVNPQGQWLFLRDAAQRIVPALASHLRPTR